MATIKRCNMCGEEISKRDYEGLTVSHTYGYNSIFDCSRLDFDLCVKCLDKTTQNLIDNCKINPVID